MFRKALIQKRVESRRRKSGSLLLFTVIFMLIIATAMIPGLQLASRNAHIAGSTRSSDQAFYIAEAGIARAISELFAVRGLQSVTNDSQNQTMFQNAIQQVVETVDNPWYPWGDAWLSMEDVETTIPNGANGEASDPRACKVSMWRNAGIGWTIQSVGRSMTPRAQYRTIQVQVSAQPFSGYAFFNSDSLSSMDGQVRWLAPGETFNGIVHSNRHLFVYGTSGSPLTFNSDVQVVGSIVGQSSPNNVVVYNGLKNEDAEYITLPDDMGPLISAADSNGVHLPADDQSPSLPTTGPQAYTDPNVRGSGGSTSDINNYKFVFNADGTVTITNMDKKVWMTGNSSQAVAWRAANGYTVATAGDAASWNVTIADTNGAFVVDEGNVFVSGTVNGRATVLARANDNETTLIAPFNNSRTDGNIIVDGNLVYNTHPTGSGTGYTNGYLTSNNRDFDPDDVTDVLGLVGERNFALDGSAPSNCIVDAHIMLTGQASPNPDVRTWPTTTASNQTISQAVNQDGAFFIEDGVQRDLSELWSGIVDGESGNGSSTGSGYKGTSNNLYLTGGIVHFLRGQTANGTGGYTRRYAYDTRLNTDPPPFYPLTGSVTIIGWSDTSSTTDPTA